MPSTSQTTQEQQPSQPNREDTSSNKQDRVDRLLMAMLEAPMHNKPLPPVEIDNASKGRVHDDGHGITGYGINESHAFEHQFLSWRTSVLTEEKLDHPHQLFPWAITEELLATKWHFDCYAIATAMSKNSEFQVDEARIVDEKTIQKSKEKILQRNKRVQEVVDNY